MRGPDPECTGISMFLSAGFNELSVSLSKAIDASGMQAPLRLQGCKYSLITSLAQGISKMRMEEWADFRQSWDPPLIFDFYSLCL